MYEYVHALKNPVIDIIIAKVGVWTRLRRMDGSRKSGHQELQLFNIFSMIVPYPKLCLLM